ncbi:M28 family metallopeptidase [Meiothermus hypogaeus]|uniref:Aminopeptidase n=2 Tax=Meiothermus hypogaeus TaxID=884155 RepID=A0A511QXN0_9DEIN|nr:M28 family peptidase [Meiothermus hypogaeus]RIH80880.1 Peptidase family M28 [Meiothermus hypogaeus]GEM82144.1 aminopeptidase [Meiothermus hypogaeus NBRC 106114]
MRKLWEALCALPHRGSATALEAQVAQQLKDYLARLGADISLEVQTFQAPRSYGPELILISLLLAAGGLGGLWWLALLGTYGFWAHFSGWWVPWRRLFDRYPSQNVLAQTGQGHKTLVLMAHYDTAKSFFLYHPKQVRYFRRNFLINAVLATALPFGAMVPVVSQLLGLYFLVQAALLTLREFREPYVNGANDNATGVAVAVALFEELVKDPLPDYRVMLALTGSEEVGAKGAEHLARSGRVPPDALVLNIDNVGKGELFYATGEGMLVYHAYLGVLLERARATSGAQPLAYRLAFFDTRPFAARNIPCLTLIRLENGTPPHWHWPSDRPDGVDWGAVEETLNYARTLVRQLA